MSPVFSYLKTIYNRIETLMLYGKSSDNRKHVAEDN